MQAKDWKTHSTLGFFRLVHITNLITNSPCYHLIIVEMFSPVVWSQDSNPLYKEYNRLDSVHLYWIWLHQSPSRCWPSLHYSYSNRNKKRMHFGLQSNTVVATESYIIFVWVFFFFSCFKSELCFPALKVRKNTRNS